MLTFYYFSALNPPTFPPFFVVGYLECPIFIYEMLVIGIAAAIVTSLDDHERIVYLPKGKVYVLG